MIMRWYYSNHSGQSRDGTVYSEGVARLYSDKFKVRADFLWPNLTVIGDGTMSL